MWMTSLANGGDFFLKYLGFVLGLPLCRTRTIWCDDYLRIRHQLNTNWYDAVRCNKMQHDGDTLQYEAVRWWWGINTIALWCDENTIGTNRNLHEPMQTCVIQYDNAIVAHRIATFWVAADRRRIPVRMYTNGYECTTMRYKPIGTETNWYDVRRCNTTQYE